MMSKLNHLIFHKDHPLSVRGVNSGAENATLWLARTLAKCGHNVFVAGIIKEGDCQEFGVTFWDLGAGLDTSIAFERIKEFGAYHVTSACRALPLIQSQSDKNCLSRNFIAHDPSGTATGIAPSILSKVCDNIICVSEAQKKLFSDAGVDKNKICVIPNGADLEVFPAADITKRKWNRFIFVGALVTHKGIDILLNAFSSILGEFPDSELHVYGSASMWGQEKFFDEKEIEKQCRQIVFHGAVPQAEISKAFQTAGACIIPSRWFDSFPLTAVEALVTGCPLIAFNVGGISEALTNENQGILLPEPNEEALRDTLLRVLRNPKQLATFSENALKTSRQTFTWDNFVDKFHAKIADSVKHRNLSGGQVGFITTWNQECGLATYASFLTSQLPKDSFVIFAETTTAKTRIDEDFVTRCWNRNSSDYSPLTKAVLASNIAVLHLNCHPRFFTYPQFNGFLDTCRAKGITVIVSIHNLFTKEDTSTALFRSVDKILVHAEENIIEAVTNGASLDQVIVVPHGVHVRPPLSTDQKNQIRKQFQIADDEKLIVTFGFIQAHKGIEALLESVEYLRRIGVKAVGAVCGSTHSEDAQGQQYLTMLKTAAGELGIKQHLRFIDRFLTEDEVGQVLGAADAVLMNYRSQHFEASGACSLAVGAGAAVVTSIAPPFLAFKDAVFHATAGYPVPMALERILTDSQVRDTLTQKAYQYADTYSWQRTAQTVQTIYRQQQILLEAATKKESVVMTSSNNQSRLKVLLCNRPSTFTHRGGDTVVIERLMEGLKGHAVDVTLNLEGTHNPKDFDILHIFNFALPDMVKYYAELALKSGTPYVITTLLEDVPLFHYQSHFVSSVLQQYQAAGQSAAYWEANRPDYRSIEKAPAFDNTFAAQHAAALYSNGATESRAITESYNTQKNIVEVKLGYELGATGNADRFTAEFGLKDFVLCVGRIESRKNQLMLLKALEHDDVTVVLAGGGFSYQPEYAAAVQNFKRRGKTVVLPKLTDTQLADCYAAAKVHALPSWYELPGLVSLEAAFHGCNVVATKNGTAKDYLGEYAFYCEPGEEDSIRTAVLAAYYAPVNPNLKEKVMKHSWKEMADKTYQSYQEVSGWKPQAAAATIPSVAIPTIAGRTDQDLIRFQEELEKGELLAKDHEFEKALAAFTAAESFAAADARLHRARGATLLASGNVADAKESFKKSLALESDNAKSLCGLGMTQAMSSEAEAAYASFVASLKANPDSEVSILQLVSVAYHLGRFTDLEQVLRAYTSKFPTDVEMRFCLVGCLYKQNKMPEASVLNDSILATHPAHVGALEMKGYLPATSHSAHQPLAASVEVERAPQSRSDLSSVTTDFNSFDQEIILIEDCKRRSKYDEALSRIAACTVQSGITPTQMETLQCQKAEVLVLTDRYVEAEQLYATIVAQNAMSARAICGQAALTAANGEWAKAKSLFAKALEYRSEYDVALSGLGLCSAQEKNPAAAWTFYNRALKSNPENTRALLGTIETGYSLQKLTDVEQVIRNYLEVHPADLDFMYSLAGCCFAQGKVMDAVEAINTITLFEPNHKNARELEQMIKNQSSTISSTL